MESTKATTTTRRARKPARTPEPSADFSRMVATAAYFRAEKRGFTPGHEVQDWLEAEAEIEALLTARASKPAVARRGVAAKARTPAVARSEQPAPKKRSTSRTRKPKGH